MDVGCEEGVKDGTLTICQSNNRDRVASDKMERTMEGVDQGWGRQELVFRLVQCEMPLRYPDRAKKGSGMCKPGLQKRFELDVSASQSSGYIDGI